MLISIIVMGLMHEIVLLDFTEEPPIRQVSDDSEREDEFATANQRKSEESSSTHHLGIVQVPI